MAPPRRPRHIDLGPHRIPITWPATITVPADDDDPDLAGKTLMGLSTFKDATIEVATAKTSHTQQASTLLHEILHQIFNDTALDQIAHWTPDLEEFICTTIEGRLLELFVRPENRPALAWLSTPPTG